VEAAVLGDIAAHSLAAVDIHAEVEVQHHNSVEAHHIAVGVGYKDRP